MQLHAWQGISSVSSLPIPSLLFLRIEIWIIVEDLEPLTELSDENQVETEKQPPRSP
ncbi:hypothetical protein BYT27DRAFT_7205312 [Phlegmacium glaucopus]|nr:hypothetical protein BYT27DRAFT_7205312 [Phlegmacium glaucopus]